VPRPDPRAGLRRLPPVLLPLVALGCASAPPNYTFAEDFEQNWDDVETSLSIQPAKLAPGDVALMTLTIANVGSGSMQLLFPERRQIGLAVFEEGGGLWYTDVDTIKVPRRVGLASLQRWTYEIEWDGAVEKLGEREPLPAGRWELQVGLRRSGDVFVNRSDRVPVEILGP